MNKQIDSSIPVLTEIITAPAKPETEAETPAEASAGQAQADAPTEILSEIPAELSATAASTLASGSKATPVGKSGPAHPALGIRMLNATTAAQNEATLNPTTQSEQQADWQALELQVREAVLKQVLGRIDFVLEHRVRDNLADVLQIAVTNLSNEIRSGLEKTLSDVISRAVTQEITKLRQPK